MRDSRRRLLVWLRSVEPLPYALLFWLGAASGLARGVAFPPLALVGLSIMFWRVARAPTLAASVLSALSFGSAEAGVCFLGSLSWGAYVPLSLTLLGVLVHHLPLALWARWMPGRLRGQWLWLGSVGFSASLSAFAELIGMPNREAMVVVSAWPELVGGARLVGSDLITGVIESALLAAALTLAQPRAAEPLLPALGRALRPLLLGALALGSATALANASAPRDADSVAVGIPQIAADSTYYKSRLVAPEIAQAFDHTFEAVSRSLSRAELVITTESFDGRFGLMLPSVRKAWAERARTLGQAWLMTSYVVHENGRKANAAGAFSADGRLVGVHEKVDLAPFGERDLSAGDGYRPLPIAPGISLGVLICQESYLRRGPLLLARAGANLLAATTSDVTFGSSTTVIEHLAMTELRAIESGRSIVWASNAGPSGVIDRRGRFHHGPFRVPAGVELRAALHQDITPFHRYWLLWSLLGPVLTGIALLTARRSSSEPSAERPRRRHGARQLALQALGSLAVLACALLTAVATSAAVEARWGQPSRARAAITDTFRAKRTLSPPAPYRRFLRPAGHSAEGALAYLLEYYGLDGDQSRTLAELPPAADLATIARFLKQHYGLDSRRVPLDGPLPLMPMLLRDADGEMAVVDYAGSGMGSLIELTTGRARYVPAAELAGWHGVEALFPFD